MSNGYTYKNRETVFDCGLYYIDNYDIVAPDGRLFNRYLIHNSDSVAIIIENENHQILVQREYRTGMGRETPGLTAGRIEEGEEPYCAALREVSEETGYNASGIELLRKVCLSEGILDENTYIFYARVDTNSAPRHEQKFDSDEKIENLEWISLDEFGKEVTGATAYIAYQELKIRELKNILYYANTDRLA